MRVLQIHNRYRLPGGEDTLVEDELELLRGRGHEVHQLIFSNPDDVVGSAASLAVAPWNSTSRARVAAAVRDFKPDVMHVHNTWFRATPAVFRVESDVATVMSLHNFRLLCVNALLFRSGATCTDCVGRGPWRGVAHRCYRTGFVPSLAAAATISLHRTVDTWSRVDRYVALTEFVRDIHVQGGVDPSRISVFPDFADDPGHRPRPPSRSDYVMYVGRLSIEKGVDTLVEAWLRGPLADLRLVVIGDGPERARLESIGAANVEFRGHVDREEVTDLMMGARALLLPSRCFEGGQPRVLLEAMGCGLPVVVSDLGGMAETLENGRVGLLVPVDDVDEWVRVVAALRDDAEVDRLGDLARRNYEKRHTPAMAALNLEATYREAMATRV
ncbi:MAG TPA: glycosyltransferase family 4 protein [Acidimicrobiia bacterium]|nr:glycosyltransferase family 4 protein [Acidimicrobiia bacterium]